MLSREPPPCACGGAGCPETLRGVMPTLLPRVSTRILCVVALCAVGCRTWQPVAIPRTGAEPASAVTRARVTYRDGRVSEVGQVRFARDSMHATRAGIVFAVPADSLRS